MIDTTIPRRPFFEITGLRFRLWPIVMAAVLSLALTVPQREAAAWIVAQDPSLFHHQLWLTTGFLPEILQIVTGLFAVLIMSRVLPQADAYLRWPTDRRYLALGVAIAIAMAVTMLLADYWPQLLSGTLPKLRYEMTPAGISGWLLVMLTAGPNEEIIFRGVLVGMLTVLVPGRVRAGRFEIPVSGFIVALLFSASHYQSFFVNPLSMAIPQQGYAFLFTLVYVWLMERSRSMVPGMIAHGLSDAMEVSAAILWLTFLH